MTTLYIIGNGFDMHHGMDTSYISYAKFIKLYYPSTYDLLIEYFGLTDIDQNTKWDPLWARFEEVLGHIYAEDLLEKYSEYSANPASDNFSDGDWDTIAVLIEDEIDNFLKEMNTSFSQFIENVKYPICVFLKKLKINKNAFFLNFNYTHTLEKYYKVNRKNIKYIHNRSRENQKLILGHGVKDPQIFKEKVLPQGLSNEELHEWHENMNDDYDFSVEKGKWEIESYYKKSLKNTATIIEENLEYFNHLNRLDEIIVIGHSISKVDHDYFHEIIKNIDVTKVNWIVSFYNDSSKEKLENEFNNLEVPISNISYKQINTL